MLQETPKTLICTPLPLTSVANIISKSFYLKKNVKLYFEVIT